LRDQLRTTERWRRSLIASCAAAALVLGVGLSVLLHFSHTAYPLLSRLTDVLYPNKPLALRQLDPTCRLRGWQTLAAEIDALRAQLRTEGIEPVVAGCAWWVPGELGFYCAGRPTVYSVGLVAGDRHSQYDLWRPHPVADPQAFHGKTFVLVGEFPAEMLEAFAVVRPPLGVVHRVAGRPVSAWTVRIAEGFRGFTALRSPAAH